MKKIKINPWPQRVRRIRAKNGFSTKGLAAMIGVSHRTVEDWEQGRRRPSGPAQKMLEMIDNDKI
jgi:putative transcriptional regulator